MYDLQNVGESHRQLKRDVWTVLVYALVLLALFTAGALLAGCDVLRHGGAGASDGFSGGGPNPPADGGADWAYWLGYIPAVVGGWLLKTEKDRRAKKTTP